MLRIYYSAGSPSVFYLHSYRIELSPFSVIKAFDLMACKEYSTASQSDTIFMSESSIDDKVMTKGSKIACDEEAW